MGDRAESYPSKVEDMSVAVSPSALTQARIESATKAHRKNEENVFFIGRTVLDTERVKSPLRRRKRRKKGIKPPHSLTLPWLRNKSCLMQLTMSKNA